MQKHRNIIGATFVLLSFLAIYTWNRQPPTARIDPPVLLSIISLPQAVAANGNQLSTLSFSNRHRQTIDFTLTAHEAPEAPDPGDEASYVIPPHLALRIGLLRTLTPTNTIPPHQSKTLTVSHLSPKSQFIVHWRPQASPAQKTVHRCKRWLNKQQQWHHFDIAAEPIRSFIVKAPD